jgi:acyl-CoA thioester hydrolase
LTYIQGLSTVRRPYAEEHGVTAVESGDEVWRGGVNAWECDDMGHMNTRFYVQRANEGMQLLIARLGLPGLFRPRARSTALIEEMHIRFHREALVGTPLRMTGAVTEVRDAGIDLVLSLHDLTGDECKATFRLRLRHVDAGEEAEHIQWPREFVNRALDQLLPLPENARPRSTGSEPAASPINPRLAQDMGMVRLAMGVIGPDRADIFGRMALNAFIGSVSDGIRSLTPPYRAIVARHAPEPPQRVGGAVVETRIVHSAWPRIGDAYEICSGLAFVDGPTMSLIHWMFDPVTGRHFGSMQSVAVTFDLDRRKLVPITDVARAELQRHCVAGLAL